MRNSSSLIFAVSLKVTFRQAEEREECICAGCIIWSFLKSQLRLNSRSCDGLKLLAAACAQIPRAWISDLNMGKVTLRPSFPYKNLCYFLFGLIIRILFMCQKPGLDFFRSECIPSGAQKCRGQPTAHLLPCCISPSVSQQTYLHESQLFVLKKKFQIFSLAQPCQQVLETPCFYAS